jgi:4-hydroxy-2-oxoheptanedioate aldolase
VDCEHGNIADNEMYLAVGAIAAAGASPIVRIPAGEVWMMKRALDAGAHGIMIPMCETKVSSSPSPFISPLLSQRKLLK